SEHLPGRAHGARHAGAGHANRPALEHQRLSAGQPLDHDRAHPERPPIAAGRSAGRFLRCTGLFSTRSRAGPLSLAAPRAAAAYPGGGRPGLGAAEAIASVEADLLLEASPTAVRTGEPGLSHIRAALRRGMHVVTANKGPLVVAYHDLMRAARGRGVELRHAA